MLTLLFLTLKDPQAWNLKGYTGFFWGATALLTFIWAFFRLPESKGRTYEEMDMLFAERVPARRFAQTHVDTRLHHPESREQVPALTG